MIYRDYADTAAVHRLPAEPVTVLACSVIANLARHSSHAQSQLAEVGAVRGLADYLMAHTRTTSRVSHTACYP